VRRLSAVAGVWAQRERTLCFTVYPPYMILTSYVGVTGFESRPGYWTLLLLLLLLLLLFHLSFHSVAVVLTEVQTKQIRITIHKRSNTKTQYKQYKTQYIQVHILPAPPTQLSKHTHLHSPIHCKTSSNNHNTRYTPNEIVTIQSGILIIRSHLERFFVGFHFSSSTHISDGMSYLQGPEIKPV
jgi:hypothetical protein